MFLTDRKHKTAQEFKFAPTILCMNNDLFHDITDPAMAVRIRKYKVKELPAIGRSSGAAALQPYAWKTVFESNMIWIPRNLDL